MAPLPPLRDRTLLLSDAALVEAEAKLPPRPYLGMSAIGDTCPRKLWYGFRWVKRIPFDAKTLKKFRDGHAAEAMVIDQLKLVDAFDVVSHDPFTGEQIAFSDFGGHFSGHSDGEISGIVEAPKTKHVLEVKATEKMAELEQAIIDHGEKDALRHWWPTYFAQAQCYMGYGGYTRHFLVATTPGARNWRSIRTEFDKGVFQGLRSRAEHIIFSERPPQRLCPSAAFYEAGWCKHVDTCFGDPTHAGRSCRTCAFVTPERDGDWTCAMRNGDPLTLPEQRTGCPKHRYHPHLLDDRRPVRSDGHNITYELANGGQWTDEGK
jgi:hypothetical protein